MLHEDETSVVLQKPIHFQKGSWSIRNRTQRPRDHDSIYGLIRDWQSVLGRLQEKFHPNLPGQTFPLRHSLDFHGWIYAIDTLNIIRIEGQIQARADSHFQYLAARMGNPSSAQASGFLIPHGKANDAWQDVFCMKPIAPYLLGLSRS